MDTIDIRNGLRQGCCMARVLFNLSMFAIVEKCGSETREADEVSEVGLLYE